MINGFKKYLTLGLFVVFVGLFGFCNGYNNSYTLLNSKYLQIIDNNRTITTQGAVNWSNYHWTIESDGNISTSYNSDNSSGIYLPINDSYNRLYHTISVFWNNNKLYYFNSNSGQGYFKYFCTGSIDNYASNITNDFINCLTVDQGGVVTTNNYETYLKPIEQFNNNSNLHNNIVGIIYTDSNNQGNYNNRPSPFGFVYSDNSFIIFEPFSRENFFGLTGSLEINIEQPMSFDKFKSLNNLKQNAPVVDGNSSAGGTIIPIDTDVDSIINYYETRFGWNSSMCYVGTDNLSADYGTSGVGFENGTGDSIFGLYYSIYGSYGNNIVKNVGKFINVWLLNYSQWFYNNDNIRWLATDNGPDTNVSYIYTGFTFPFANKPVAIYFMASNLYDGYSTETSQGEDMAFYCYSKLNYQQIKDGDINFEEVKSQVNSGIVGRIEDYNNYQFGNNTGNYQVPTSGTFWDSFGTGYENTDIDLDKTFSDYFTEITNVFQNYSPLYSTGIIPDYILYALIFLLLFRIMKH